MRCKFSHARYKGPDGFCVFLYHTQDLQVPVEARRHSRYGTDWALITAVGYGLTDTSSVDVELSLLIKKLLLVITHGIMSAPFRKLISFGKNLSNNCINADFGIFVDFRRKYVIMRKMDM